MADRRCMRTVAASCLALVALVACGDDPERDEAAVPSASTASTSVTPTEPATTTTLHLEDGAFVFDAVDFQYEVVPETIPVGTRLTMRNRSASEAHEIVVFRVPDADDRTAAEMLADPTAALEDPVFAGEPVLVVIQTPDMTDPLMGVGDGVMSEPGRYVVLCGLPIGGEAGADPHFSRGMFGEFTVE